MEKSRFVAIPFTAFLCLSGGLQTSQQAHAQTQKSNSAVIFNDDLRQANISAYPFRTPNINDQFYGKLYYSDAKREPQRSPYDLFVEQMDSAIGHALCLKNDVRFASSSIATLTGRLKTQTR
jgi:hypothetical protein